ncbi:hypothetical protein CRG98_018711 [Punica granatum]|uniref:C2H2-type domain-containing protein n=1 Tax=Punica granatum TaxID=22663 RepID=A0A2I0JZK4_PUNGR|nr:hypothetical protein CRG98_018711 [Punica granatum]
MPAEVGNSSPTASGEASVSSSGNQPPPPPPTAKKKRNLPGMPDPDAEVIALSPKTLLATNRFVCEICNKGFQRDQNLQLHRRGHNLPWKLRQRSGKEVKKRVYVCPELTCVHHDPSRALGDLTGIKKHFCRKHGEKKWKCEKCSKKYAVQSDWKAHSKICGTREYKCDCGTLFSRRDSFITHRAFCDALAEESAKAETQPQPQPQPQPYPPDQDPRLTMPSPATEKPDLEPDPKVKISASPPPPPPAAVQPSATVLSSILADPPAAADLIRAMAQPDGPSDLGPSPSLEPISLCLSTNHGGSSSLFGGPERRQYAPPPPPPSQPAMSATALLQKAAQMGATATNASLLRGLGIVPSQPSSGAAENIHWASTSMDSENASVASGLGLGLPSDGSSGLKELMMGTPSVFGPSKTTLDFLGLGMAVGGSPNGSLSALITSIGGGLDVAATAAPFGGGDFSGKEMGRRS